MLRIQSKLPDVGTTIFTVMSRLATEHQAINLGQGFPNFDCPDDLKESIARHLYSDKNQYAPMAGVPALNEAIGHKIFQSYKLSLKADQEITITAGATQALYTAITAFVNKGDEVIIIEPAYDSYRPAILLAGGIPVSYALSGPEYRMDWSRVASMITQRTRMIIINTPHNPIGKTFSDSDMRTLQEITRSTGIIVLSDEVYEHLIYDKRVHRSVCLYPELFRRCIAVFSFGKTFHATGWKIGYAIGPANLMKEFRKVHQYNVFSVNSFVQYALAEYLTDASNYNYLPDFFQAKRDFLQKSLSNSRFKPVPCEGTYFQLYDYSEISDQPDVGFAEELTVKHGVTAIPVSVFYHAGRQDRMIRLCFAKTEDVLSAAAERLCKI